MAFQPVPIDAACVLALELQDSLGTSYADNTPYGNHATRTGAAQTNGPCGLALAFDGTDDKLAIADAASLDCTALTIVAHARLDATWAAAGYILAKCEDTDANFSYAFGVDANRKPFLTVSDDGDAGTTETAAAAVSAAVWHQLACTFSGGTYKLYVDGTAVAGDAGGAAPSIKADTGRVTIGARFDSGAAGYANFFKGKIGGVWVWNRALGAQDIHELHAVHAGDDTNE